MEVLNVWISQGFSKEWSALCRLFTQLWQTSGRVWSSCGTTRQPCSRANTEDNDSASHLSRPEEYACASLTHVYLQPGKLTFPICHTKQPSMFCYWPGPCAPINPQGKRLLQQGLLKLQDSYAHTLS